MYLYIIILACLELYCLIKYISALESSTEVSKLKFPSSLSCPSYTSQVPRLSVVTVVYFKFSMTELAHSKLWATLHWKYASYQNANKHCPYYSLSSLPQIPLSALPCPIIVFQIFKPKSAWQQKQMQSNWQKCGNLLRSKSGLWKQIYGMTEEYTSLEEV